jgi:hypothetical protein
MYVNVCQCITFINNNNNKRPYNIYGAVSNKSINRVSKLQSIIFFFFRNVKIHTMCNLGLMYYYKNRQGVEPSPPFARKWWTEAANQGQENANYKFPDTIRRTKINITNYYSNKTTVNFRNYENVNAKHFHKWSIFM